MTESREKTVVESAEVPAAENSFALLSAGVAREASTEGSGPGTVAVLTKEDTGLRGTSDTAVRPAPSAVTDPDQQARVIEQSVRDPLNRLIEELNLCRRYHEATFPNKTVDRLIFVGGEARQRSLCAHVAREMGLAAQVGDPLVRMGRISDVGIESGIDRRQPQPNWSVAIGLSIGPGNEQPK
jgi:Tfp pilus assembly PilM family ATPase